MIAKLTHHVRKWIEEKKREKEVNEEFNGYIHARKLSERGAPTYMIEREVEDRIYFSRGSGHFEKGMLKFLRNKKAFQERRDYGHE